MELKSRIPRKYRKVLAAAGIATVLGSWVVVPYLAEKFFGTAVLDTAFRLTFFWSIVWLLNHLRKKRF